MSSRTIYAAVALAVSGITAGLTGPVTAQEQAVSVAEAVGADRFRPTDFNVRIAGRLLLPDGKPAVGASLHVAWMDAQGGLQFRKVEVGTAGRFQWQKSLKQIPPHVGGIALFAGLPDKGTLFRSVPWSSARNQALALRLESFASVAGRLVGPDGSALSGVKLTVKKLRPDRSQSSTADANGRPQLFFFTESLPDKIMKAGQAAVTDTNGRFQLAGLPRGTTAQIAPPDGLMFAAGSRRPLDITRPVNHAGLLVVTKPGSLQVRVTDPVAGLPVKGIPVTVTPIGPSPFFGAQTSGEDIGAAGIVGAGSATNEVGRLDVDEIVPGEYSVEVSGLERIVSVRPGAQEVVSISVRSGTLTGKVLGPDGKPSTAVPVTIELPATSARSRTAQMVFNGGGPAAQAQTGLDGRFEIPSFPWGAKEVTLRAASGHDEVQWKGDPATIKGELLLRMQRGALVTVKGRLVDPHYKPLRASKASVIQWRDDQPRITWLFTAQPAEVDKAGRFTIQGLRRGEPFSVISGSPFRGPTDENGFESPRFEVTAPSGVTTQDLGDVVVHPLDGADQILQVYGFESREQIARLSSLMLPPRTESVEEARRALAAYATAIEHGDMARVHQATSRVTPGWSSDLSGFVRSIRLRGSSLEEIASAEPLRFIPRISLAYVLTFSRAQSFFSLNFGASARELEEKPDWVMFVSANEATPRSLGLLRREEGEWRVVNLDGLPDGLDDFILLGPGRQPGEPANMRTTAPRPPDAERKSLEAVAREYLVAWEQEDAVRIQQLTSPFSATWGKDAAAMRLALERRTDEGRCPARKPGSALRVMDDLSTWETAWLATYAGSIHQISGGRQAPPRVPAGMQKGFPGAYAARGDIAVARYEAAEGAYLMVLVRLAGDWRVLEAAIPL
jgi:hypothetical protein